ncbi:MAG: hypothetical protein ABIP33_01665 [Pseudolysinimonas sp.]
MIGILRRFGILALGVIAMIGGGILLNNRPAAAFGWTAYAPLTNTTFVPPFVTPTLYLGVGLILIGLALTAGWIGFRLGRRQRV